ncbi:MAG: carbonic anhydrase [bacterium]
MISAKEALERLKTGNQRYVSGARQRSEKHAGFARRIELVHDQAPFTAILGCSDSRVAPEIVFDQGLGDLFVVRVAGNIAAPSQVGSIEFAAGYLETRLVVVLGHSRCGTILAGMEAIHDPAATLSPDLSSLMDRIRPSIEAQLAMDTGVDRYAKVRDAVRANIRVSVEQLRHGSKLLEQLIRTDGLQIIGAEYSLDTGVVDFFDGASVTG